MPQLMFGQGHDRSPGVQELLYPEGVVDRGDRIPSEDPCGSDLVVLPREIAVRPRDVEVVVTSGLLADLYDPTLVISHGYVGPDRRRSDRSAPVRRGLPGWLHRVGQVVLLTAVVVIPLTMIAARSVPPAANGTSPAPATGQAAPKLTAASRHGALHHAPHVFTATSQQIARAEAAYQKALARAGAAGAPSGPAAPTDTAAAQASQAAASVAAVQHQAAQQAAQQAAAGQRAATQAATAQARADSLAAEAQRRAARAAAQAQAQAARSAGHGGAGTPGAPGAGTPTTGGTAGGPPPGDGASSLTGS